MRLPAMALLLAAIASGCSHYEVSPLAAAARTGDLAQIDRLLDGGADINAGSGVNNWPPVIHAIHKGQLGALTHLIDRGALVTPDVVQRALNVAHGSPDEAAVRAVLTSPRHAVS